MKSLMKLKNIMIWFYFSIKYKSTFSNNIISVGISLESQLIALINFIKTKKEKYFNLYPKNKYTGLIEEKLDTIEFKFKPFVYNPNPEILTGEIEKLTNYSEKKKFKLRKKCLKIKMILNQ